MPRPILDEQHIHPTIREKVANNRVSIVKEVQESEYQGETCEEDSEE